MASNSIEDWLAGIGLPQYVKIFRANDITLEILATLNDADLKECGIQSFGHRKLILHRIREWPIAAASPPAKDGVPARPEPEPMLASAEITPASYVARETPKPAPEPAAKREIAVTKVEIGSPPRKSLWKRILASNVFLISVLLHVLFGILATYLIVQTIQAKRKLTFQGGPNTPSASTRALEHQINMTRRQQTMSAPAQMKRITTTGLAKITLPDMPSLPAADDITPDKMAGMGALGVGFGFGGGGGGGGGNGKGVTLFGINSGGAFVGSFYDLKQTADRTPIPGMDGPGLTGKFVDIVRRFYTGGWNVDDLDNYYKSPNRMRFTQLFLPKMSDQLGPECFGEEKNCKPLGWIVHYKGKVTAPESFKFRFVGGADDWILVRFNNENVLEGGWVLKSDAALGGLGFLNNLTVNLDGFYTLAGYQALPRGYARSHLIEVNKGETYNMEILIGESVPVFVSAALLIEVDGTQYNKDANGSPILPLFRTVSGPLPPAPDGTTYPPHDEIGPIWTVSPN